MLNERGVVLGTALLILCILTIIGTASLSVTRTELLIVRNFQVHHENFYASEGGLNLTPEWLKAELAESDYKNIDYVGNFGKSYFDFPQDFFKRKDFSVEVKHQVRIDPSDGVKKVLLYGDEDGDYLNEVNFNVGIPLEISTSDGTDTFHGGQVKIEGRWIYKYIFVMPDAALRVNSSVNGNGVSGSIIGEHQSGSDCGDVPDIMYDVVGGTIDYNGDMGDSPVISESGGMYPYALMKPTLMKNATQTLTPVNGKVEADAIVTSESETGVIFVTGDTKITNLTGYGILVVDGNFECAGNLDWHGIIIVGNDIVLSGGGSKVIYGSIVAMGDADAINGSVDIQYDCNVLQDLQDRHSRYKLTSWRQL